LERESFVDAGVVLVDLLLPRTAFVVELKTKTKTKTRVMLVVVLKKDIDLTESCI
jgi:ribosome biogenesis GTPase A